MLFKFGKSSEIVLNNFFLANRGCLLISEKEKKQFELITYTNLLIPCLDYMFC